ncbi:MAG: hypothetical protein EBZ48_12725 [Proteobacteria bacterium]|nr:hypothetical protein [Pseudomonadota bacterium]
MVDKPQDLRDFRSVLRYILERADVRTDLFIFGNLSMDTLDYTGPTVNEGSKGVLLGIGDPIRTLPKEYRGSLPAGAREALPFCDGCLVVSGPRFSDDRAFASAVAKHEDFTAWPLVILVDDASKATQSEMSFLWTTFTRFEPAADLHARSSAVERNHIVYTGPIVIDARMKPWYPAELACDPDTAAVVENRWREYFPKG